MDVSDMRDYFAKINTFEVVEQNVMEMLQDLKTTKNTLRNAELVTKVRQILQRLINADVTKDQRYIALLGTVLDQVSSIVTTDLTIMITKFLVRLPNDLIFNILVSSTHAPKNLLTAFDVALRNGDLVDIIGGALNIIFILSRHPDLNVRTGATAFLMHAYGILEKNLQELIFNNLIQNYAMTVNELAVALSQIPNREKK